MGFFKKAGIVFIAGIAVAGISAFFGNKYAILGLDDTEYTNNIYVNAPEKITINKNTIMEFQYSYNDGFTETLCSFPPEYMSDYSREELAKAYDGWQIQSFSPNKVIFSKTLDTESSQHYILKEHKGYIAVFYKKSGVLKELTSTPVSSLSDKERQQYISGVQIDGNENLIKHLENLES